MQYAADKFERTQPHWMRAIPFALDDAASLPSLAEVIGWIVLAFCFIALCVGFMGL